MCDLLSDAIRNEIFPHLGNYASSCGNCLPKFRDKLSVPHSSVKKSKSAVLLDNCILFIDVWGKCIFPIFRGEEV